MSIRLHHVGIVPVALLVILSAAPATLGQQKKPARKKPDYKVTIYDDEFLKGRNVAIRQAVADMELLKFNDKSESIAWNLPPGKSAVLCDEKNFERPVLVLVGHGEVEDLGKQQPNALHCVSSVAFLSSQKGRYPRGVSTDVPRLGTEN